MIRIGVIADTHVPDRRRAMHPQVVSKFRSLDVAAILHAGDVSAGPVLDALQEIAPVHAVRGNRDWVALRHLPLSLQVSFGGVEIAITHGHGPPLNYVRDRIDYLVRGYRLELFAPRLLRTHQGVRVIVFGHTHRPLCQWVDGVLLFNPGSPHFPDPKGAAPSLGIMRISTDGQVEGEIIELS